MILRGYECVVCVCSCMICVYIAESAPEVRFAYSLESSVVARFCFVVSFQSRKSKQNSTQLNSTQLNQNTRVVEYIALRY